MKKLLTAIIAMMLIAAMVFSALAVGMYVNTESNSVYSKNSKKSKVISHLPFGGGVQVIETSGKWSHITYINKNGVEKSGWMLSSQLSSSKPCKHEWGEWKVTKKATCTKEGEKQHTCKKCGTTQTKKIEKLDHEWGKWKVTKQPTCTKEGERTHKCKICDTKKTEKIKKKNHAFGEWTIVKQATCVAKGERTRKCANCGYVQTGTIEKTEHEYGDWTTITAPTRDTDGERECICEICGERIHQIVEAEPSLNRKERSEAVRAAQRMLNDLGYKAGGADGSYGPKMDKAFSAFAEDNGIDFDGGHIKPSQLDALVNAWIAARPEADWVNVNGLGLAVTLDEATDDTMTFTWTLTNGSSSKCTLSAVVVGEGSEIDFNHDNMVGALDNVELKANGGEASGTINLPAEMFENTQDLSFCAIATGKEGGTWTSNTVDVDLY